MSHESDPGSSAAVFKSRAKDLANLLTIGEEHSRLWQPDELASIFRHQISTPMLVDLDNFDPHAAGRLKILSEAHGLLLKSFADLFHHAAPPVELLRLVKDFAKANVDAPESGLPVEIASALYYTSIASAMVHLNVLISKLPEADLKRGLSWTSSQSWLDEKTRALLAEALGKLSGSGQGGTP